jgi:hypothetical protein
LAETPPDIADDDAVAFKGLAENERMYLKREGLGGVS